MAAIAIPFSSSNIKTSSSVTNGINQIILSKTRKNSRGVLWNGGLNGISRAVQLDLQKEIGNARIFNVQWGEGAPGCSFLSRSLGICVRRAQHLN